MKDYKDLYIVIASVLIILFVIVHQGTYAYFTAEVSNTGNRKSTLTTSRITDLKIINGTTSFNNKMIPGERITHTFQVKNENTINVCFRLKWENVENTFVNTSDLHVSLSDGTNQIPLVLNTFPTTSATLASGLIVNANSMNNYTMTVEYVETTDNQIEDMIRSFQGSIVGEITECS